MPLYQANEEQRPGAVRMLIWHVEEPEEFFVDALGFTTDRKLEKRRLEHLAGRFLLKRLLPDFPFSRVEVTRPGKPCIPNSGLHFSISHSFPYVAAVMADKPVGVDVQVFTDKIARLQQKFLSAGEQAFFQNDPRQLTLAWTAKEAAFKWFGEGGVDFIRHMPIRSYENVLGKARMEMAFLRTESPRILPVDGAIESDFAWSVVTMP